MDQDHQPSPDTRAGLVSTTLSEWKTLAILGGPILIAQLALMANGVIDTVMAGHASAEDLSGVGIGASLWSPLFLFFAGVLTALQPIISGHRGSATIERIMPLTWQGLYVAMAASLVMILVLTQVQPFLQWRQLEPVTSAITLGYLHAFVWGVPAMLAMVALRGLTDGLGHTKVMMAFSLLSAAINLPLNYIFIYGKLGLPAFGGVGCGWATAISCWLAFVALLLYLQRSKTYRAFHLIQDWAAPNLADLHYLLKLGIPIGFTIFVEVSMFAVIALFLVPLGPVVVAGHQIALNVVSLIFMVPLSMGMALTLRISFLIGARQVETAHLVARSTLILALAIALLYAVGLYTSAPWIATLYTGEADVQAVTIRLLSFAALFQIADVMQVTCISALRGYHDTRLPMYIMVLSFWGFCLPLGYLLTFTDVLTPAMGVTGFWVGLTVGLSSAGLLLLTRLFWFSRPQPQSTFLRTQ